MYQGVHSFHDPAAGEHAPDADVLVGVSADEL